jgi:hypothetical protein
MNAHTSRNDLVRRKRHPSDATFHRYCKAFPSPARLERLEGLRITDDDFLERLPEMLELDSSVLALKGETARWATPPPQSSWTC